MNTLHIFYVPGRNVNSQMRTQDVTKDCFPPANKCSNCTRKNRDDVTGKSKEKKEYKRCSGCHLFAYCDKDCQREHWIKVHKKHCRLLSGKDVVPGSKHSLDSCQLCSDERESAVADLKSGDSPKTFCHIEELIFMLKTGLNIAFNFHKGETTCNCSLILAACELPFPLGELTGQYVNNIDAMLAHALRVVRAMGANDFSLRENLSELWKDLVFSRSQMWYEVLSGEKWNSREFIKSSVETIETVKSIYGATNPWWKILKFSAGLTKNMYDNFYGDIYDSRTIEDPRFETVKLIYGQRQSQLRNQAIVSENNSWCKFKLWPVFWNNSLAVVLPEGTRCQICSTTLNGPVRVTQHDDYTLPIVLQRFGENGDMEACCSVADNPKCGTDISIKDITDDQLKKFKEEMDFLGSRARICDFCSRLSIFSHRCSACLAAQYCSTQCQQEDLDFHKTVCARWAKDRSRKIRGSKKQMEVSKAFLDSMSTDETKSPVSQKRDEAKKLEAKELNEAEKLEVKELEEVKKVNGAKKLDEAKKDNDAKKDDAKKIDEDKKDNETKKLDEAKKRLLNEFKQIESDPPEGVTCAPEGDNIMVWKAVIFGPDQTVFQDGIFQLTLEFSAQYPYDPPVVTFLSQIFHPNIDGDTGMIKGILMGDWSPARRVLDILMTLRFLLVEPNLNGVYVANTEAAQLFKENRRLYNKKAQESVAKSWST